MQVFNQNFGGMYEEGRYDKISTKIETKLHPSITTAYMLFYIRIDQIKTILQEIKDTEIPRYLVETAERNRLEEEERVIIKKKLFSLYFIFDLKKIKINATLIIL